MENNKMRAARLHEVGKPMSIDLVDKPVPRSGDVLVEVKACGVIPNFSNALNPPPGIIRPLLPAVYGLDVAGVVVAVGSAVRGIEIGQRVYVNPARSCMNCSVCRRGNHAACEYAALSGYIGCGPKSDQMLADYPHGGFAQYMTAPPYSLVHLPDNLSFEMAARWGYLGTSYAALRRGNVDMNTTLLINGVSGTMGLGATLFALASGVPKIFGVGRNRQLLERVKSLAPDRIHVHSALDSDQTVEEWVRSLTDNLGVDVVVDTLPFGSAPENFLAASCALARGGVHVNPGGVVGDIPINFFDVACKDQSYQGSLWFTTQQGQEMANLVASGMVNLDVFEHRIFPLERINEVFDRVAKDRNGGFTNYVISPNLGLVGNFSEFVLSESNGMEVSG